MLAPALLLCFLLVMLSRSLQVKLRILILQSPVVIFTAPAALTGIFCLTAAYYRCLTWPLALLVVAYTFSPTALTYFGNRLRPRIAPLPNLLDFCVILLLWLPLELSVGASLVPRPMQGVLHATAYGLAITLGVFLFLLVRCWEGLKYGLPGNGADLRNILFGYIASALLLIALGLHVGFLAQAHAPRISWTSAAVRFVFIFFGTAFPEEILFRGLIQNWFTQRLKQPWQAVAVSGLIFGAAHLNNGPGSLPNWRYMAVATVAGLIFGTVFLRSTSILASVAVHAGVNLTKHLFF